MISKSNDHAAPAPERAAAPRRAEPIAIGRLSLRGALLLWRGLAMREFLSALPAAVALAAFPAVLVLAARLANSVLGGRFADSALNWAVPPIALMVPLTLGVLCGAAEEEGGTADFAYRLPLTRRRLFFEKLAGSLLAWIVWALLMPALIYLVTILSAMSGLGTYPSPTGLRGLYTWLTGGWEHYFNRNLTFFCAGLAAGYWLRRVLPAVLMAGIATGLIYLVARLAAGFGSMFGPNQVFLRLGPLNVTLGLLLTLAADLALLALAWLRVHTREGK